MTRTDSDAAFPIPEIACDCLSIVRRRGAVDGVAPAAHNHGLQVEAVLAPGGHDPGQASPVQVLVQVRDIAQRAHSAVLRAGRREDVGVRSGLTLCLALCKARVGCPCVSLVTHVCSSCRERGCPPLAASLWLPKRQRCGCFNTRVWLGYWGFAIGGASLQTVPVQMVLPSLTPLLTAA